jgi:hypothetical protein
MPAPVFSREDPGQTKNTKQPRRHDMDTTTTNDTGLVALETSELTGVRGGMTGLEGVAVLVGLLASYSGARETGEMFGDWLVSSGILDLTLSNSQTVAIRRGAL